MAIIEDAVSTDTLGINSDNEAKVALTLDETKAGFARMLDSNGDPILSTENGAMNVSIDSVMFVEQVDGAILNTNKWTTSADTMTIAQASGYITLNGAAITTANKYAILQSIRILPMYGPLPLRITFNTKVPMSPQSNATVEIGIGTVATTSAPTDGAFFRWNNSAEFRCIVNNGGSETASAALTAPTINNATLFDIIMVEDLVQFLIDDEIIATIEVPTGLAFPTNSGRLPLFARVYNASGAPSVAPQIAIGQVIVAQQAMNQNKSWGETLAALGMGLYQSPITPYTQTANYVNSTNPTAVSLSNTTAGYATLGGLFAINSQAAGATDGIVFAWQNTTGYQAFIDSISISTCITGAAIVTATVLEWAVAVNGSAVSLATTESPPTSWIRRAIPLGVQGFLALAGIGTQAPDVVRTFKTPLVVDSGRYLHIICKTPNGANTGSLVYRGAAMVTGYSE